MEKICIIPICGCASRIGNIPKFLLPINSNNTLLLNSLNNSISCDFKIIIITTPDYAVLVQNYIKNKVEKYKLYIKIIIAETDNMSETMLQISYTEKIYSLVMPDTYFGNEKNLETMNKLLEREKCDVVLGIFKIRENQKGKLGQVLFDNYHKVVNIIDKDKTCNYEWAWGCILFNKIFTKFFDINKSHIGYALMPAINAGLSIKVCKFNNMYYDCGTFSEYKELLNTL